MFNIYPLLHHRHFWALTSPPGASRRWRHALGGRPPHAAAARPPLRVAPASGPARAPAVPKHTPPRSSRTCPIDQKYQPHPPTAQKTCRSSRQRHIRPTKWDLFVFNTSKVRDSWLEDRNLTSFCGNNTMSSGGCGGRAACMTHLLINLDSKIAGRIKT